MTPDDFSDASLLSDTLPAGVRVREQIIEGFLRAVPEGRLYRVQHAVTGERAMLHEYLPEAWVRRVGDNVSVIPGRGPEFRAGMQRFLLRAQQLRAMAHPSLPRLLDLIPSHGTAFAVYPLAEVRTLAEVVEQAGGRLPMSSVWPWLNTCCDLAQWLHDQDRIHGGFDPHAVWVLGDGRLQLPPPELEEGYRPPSPWVALEQTVLASSGTPRGPWTDVYGIGALGCFMMTGQGPRHVSRRAMTAQRPAGAGPGWADSRSALLDPIPGVLKAAIRVSLMPNPRERPQDIGQFRAMLGLAEQMAAQNPSAGDGFADTDMGAGDSGFGALDDGQPGSRWQREAQALMARALRAPAPAAEAAGRGATSGLTAATAERQIATILQERPGAPHIPTLVLPVAAGPLAAPESAAPGSSVAASSSASAPTEPMPLDSLPAHSTPQRMASASRLAGVAAHNASAGLPDTEPASLAPSGAGAWGAGTGASAPSLPLVPSAPVGDARLPRARPSRRPRPAMALTIAAAAAVMALLWWLPRPYSQAPAMAEASDTSIPSRASQGAASPNPAEPSVAPALAAKSPPVMPSAPASPSAVSEPVVAALTAPPLPGAAQALPSPDQLLAQAPPAAGQPVQVAGAAIGAAQPPQPAVAKPPQPELPTPPVAVAREDGESMASARPPVARPAATKAADAAARKCQQALLEKSLGMSSAAADVGKYCR